MNLRKLRLRRSSPYRLLRLALWSASCRKSGARRWSQGASAGGDRPGVETNVLADAARRGLSEPGDLADPLAAVDESHLDAGQAARRLVFCVIAMPQQPGFQKVLAALRADPSVVKAINDHYVPVLIDGDASREIGISDGRSVCGNQAPAPIAVVCLDDPRGQSVAWIPVASREGTASRNCSINPTRWSRRCGRRNGCSRRTQNPVMC